MSVTDCRFPEFLKKDNVCLSQTVVFKEMDNVCLSQTVVFQVIFKGFSSDFMRLVLFALTRIFFTLRRAVEIFSYGGERAN